MTRDTLAPGVVQGQISLANLRFLVAMMQGEMSGYSRDRRLGWDEALASLVVNAENLVSGQASRGRPVGGSVEWYTPPELFARLGAAFDLDPAASPNATWVPAAESYHRLHDGLAQPWSGHVWLNPPYGPAGVAFVERMIEHGDGLLLLPSRTETRIYQRAWQCADSVCLLRDRLWFRRDDGKTGRSSFGSTLFAFGRWASNVLIAADLGVITERSR